MSGKKKRIPRPIKVPAIINCAVRFATVHAVVDKIERGEIDVVVINGKDVPVYNDLVDGGMYELIPALRGWCAFIEKMGEATGRTVSLKAHRDITLALERGDDICWPDLEAMRNEIRQHEAIYLITTSEQRASLAKTCQVLFEVEKLGLTQHGEACMTIGLVKILAGHRAGQFGELSELDAPPGQVYIRLAEHEHSRCRVLAKTAMQMGRFGAVTLQPWENLEVAA